MPNSETSLPLTNKPNLRLQQALLASLLVLASALLFWQFQVQKPLLWSAQASQIITLDEQYYRLNQTQMVWLESFTSAHFSEGGVSSTERVSLQIDAQLDTLFEQINSRLPLFADWYYSLSGEYSRMAMAVLSASQLVEGDYVARKAAQVLFPPALWEGGLLQLEANTNAELIAQQQQTRAAWLSQVQQLLATQRVPAPIAGLDSSQQNNSLRPLDDLWLQLGALDAIAPMSNRMALSSIGAAGLAGPALWRAVAARNALGSARVAAVSGARGGSRLGGAAAGALLCAPGGPLAVACAAGAGVATWLAADWLLLQVDEAWNREELMSHMAEALLELRQGLEAELLTAYEARIAALQEASQTVISQTFSPRDAR